MYIVGLTGISGSGKSHVGRLLGEKGIPVIDTDKVYHALISGKSKCTDEIADKLGNRFIRADGSVDRPALAKTVFASKEKLALLNSVAHRHILARVDDEIAELENRGERAVIVEAPQLFESGYDARCDLIIAVVADPDIALERIIKRDGVRKRRVSGLQISTDRTFSAQRRGS